MMTTLKFMEQPPLDPKLMTCPHCGETEPVNTPLPKPKELRFLGYITPFGLSCWC